MINVGNARCESVVYLEGLSQEHIQLVQTIIKKLEPLIEEKRESGDIANLTFEELYQPLSENEIQFVRWFETFKPQEVGIQTVWQGLSSGYKDLIRVEGQMMTTAKGKEIIPPQFVPTKVYRAYKKMMRAMKKDLGKRLLIESAYRSSAYQLYLFIYYLQNHNYSILKTAQWNAFPGYSEHGNPEKQALDFISEQGINGESNPAEFEALDEYQWLQQNAKKYGFFESYPKNDASGITYEPWHWHYENLGAARRA